jgi:hypothetical protein
MVAKRRPKDQAFALQHGRKIGVADRFPGSDEVSNAAGVPAATGDQLEAVDPGDGV